jgi:hypothetical protein
MNEWIVKAIEVAAGRAVTGDGVCKHCGEPIYWLARHGDERPGPVNAEGLPHLPECAQLQVDR